LKEAMPNGPDWWNFGKPPFSPASKESYLFLQNLLFFLPKKNMRKASKVTFLVE